MVYGFPVTYEQVRVVCGLLLEHGERPSALSASVALNRAVERQARIVALDYEERDAILWALAHDPPEDLCGLRGHLLKTRPGWLR